MDRHWSYSQPGFDEQTDEALADLYAFTQQCPDCGLYHEPSEGRDETR